MRRGAVVAGFVGYAVLLSVLRPSIGQLPTGNWWAWLQDDPERALLAGLSGIAWLVAAWLFVVTGLSLVAATSGAGARRARWLVGLITPLAVRRSLEAALATALAMGPAGMAAAGPVGIVTQPGHVAQTLAPLQPTPKLSPVPSPLTPSPVALSPVPAVPDPIVAPPAAVDIPNLDRPGAAARTPAPETPQAPPAPTSLPPAPVPAPHHLVVAGDTLWDLAAATLPAAATPAEITLAWQRWYSRNRSTIGPDPGVIRPGEALVVPQVTS